MSQAQLPNELATFLENWTTDPNNAKDAFVRFKDFLLTTPDVRFDFKARPGVSYSLRAANAKNDERPLFVLVDVVDDEPEARWLSVCFYADMVNDPDELGDFVPSGLMGKDACCLNLEEDDPAMRDYILARLGEAAASAAKYRPERSVEQPLPNRGGTSVRTKEAGRNAKPVLSLRGSHSLPGWCAGMEKRRPPSIRKDDAKQCCLLPIALPPLIEKAPEPSLRGFFSIAGHQKRTLPTGAPPTR